MPRWGKENLDRPRPGARGQCVPGRPGLRGGRQSLRRGTGAGPRQAAQQVHTREARLDLLDPAVPARRAASQPSWRRHRAPRRGARPGQGEGPGHPRAHLRPLHPVGAAATGPVRRLPPNGSRASARSCSSSCSTFGVYKKIGQQARERARLAADRARLAQEERAKLADATTDAEERAAARERDLGTLQASRRRPAACPRPAFRASPPGGRAGRGRAHPGRVAGGRPRAGRRSGTGRPDHRRRSARSRSVRSRPTTRPRPKIRPNGPAACCPEKSHVEAIGAWIRAAAHPHRSGSQAQQDELTARTGCV